MNRRKGEQPRHEREALGTRSEKRAEKLSPPARNHRGADSDGKLPRVLGVRRSPVDGPEEHLAEGSTYAFDAQVAREFEEQVFSTQIPGYHSMRRTMLAVSLYFLQGHTTFLDVGTANARIITDVVTELTHLADDRLASVRFLGMDVAQDMLDVARQLVDIVVTHDQVRAEVARHVSAGLVRPTDRVPRVDLELRDLRKGLSDVAPGSCSVVTSELVLQFVPVEHRPRLLRDIYNSLKPGGALVMVEKTLHPSVQLDDMFTRLYYDEKARNGLSAEAIRKKRQSLEGFLVPQTRRGHIELLAAAGFAERLTSPFWSCLQFEGIVAVKDR